MTTYTYEMTDDSQLQDNAFAYLLHDYCQRNPYHYINDVIIKKRRFMTLQLVNVFMYYHHQPKDLLNEWVNTNAIQHVVAIRNAISLTEFLFKRTAA